MSYADFFHALTPYNFMKHKKGSDKKYFKEKKEWVEIRQRHLIENDLIRADTYINEIVEALLQFEIDSDIEDDR